MLEIPPASISPRGQRGVRQQKSVAKKDGWLTRLARRLVFRMEVGTPQRPATLYLSSFDMIPTGSWVIVTEEDQSSD
ncbi:MAG: hypothetical protein P8J75_13385 [Actinomycetota bacterium]|jgi:hypothetical protein|nr:hypothetical protein [Actinomycetota bacterium]